MKKNQICVAEITDEIHLMTMVTDGLSVTADIIRSVSVGVNSMFGIARKTVLNSMSLRQLMLGVCS